MKVYYNEFDPFAAQWLRELMRDGLIPQGTVDERSIKEVQPEDIREFDQCHFFAGIGGWAEALRLANWGERRIWTGSCPCQPFSVAGKKQGVEDSRHLWPEFQRLIAAFSNDGKIPIVVGEQVASADGRNWLAGVRTEMEALGYAFGASDLCSAGVGSPNIRQRLYWVAYSHNEESLRSVGGKMRPSVESSVDCGLGVTLREGSQGFAGHGNQIGEPGRLSEVQTGPSTTTGNVPFWSASRFIECTDRKARRIPTEPEVFPLAHGLRNRMGVLRGAGNAINPFVAAVFLQAIKEITV